MHGAPAQDPEHDEHGAGQEPDLAAAQGRCLDQKRHPDDEERARQDPVQEQQHPSPGRLGADHHPAVRIPEDVVDDPAEHPLAAAVALRGAQQLRGVECGGA